MYVSMDKVTYQIATTLGTTEGLTGHGLEQIVDMVSGETIARFWNGNLVTIGARGHSANAECNLVSLSPQLSQASAALMEESTLVLSEVA